MINNCVVTDYITPEEYLDMRQSVEWSVFPIEQATEGIKNTTHICCNYLYHVYITIPF